jgi:hypothetical protein
MHPALRDTNLTGDEIRPLMLVGDQRYRVFAPDWHRLGKRLLTMTTTGQNPAPSTLPERRLITNQGADGCDLQWLRRTPVFSTLHHPTEPENTMRLLRCARALEQIAVTVISTLAFPPQLVWRPMRHAFFEEFGLDEVEVEKSFKNIQIPFRLSQFYVDNLPRCFALDWMCGEVADVTNGVE